jgi:redox-sensitive bicupin YhaK (pirin superfamily)
MITIRRSQDRGHADHGWLKSHHTFSFANYYDPAHIHFRHLRVINEDHIAPGAGFPTHPHRDMEIISYVVSGSLAHRDSLGNVETISTHGVQRFSAGTGIAHSEFNPSTTEPTHLLQIWILPEQLGLAPSYEQKDFGPEFQPGQWLKLASRDASDGAVKIHQDTEIYSTVLQSGESSTYPIRPKRHLWVQIVKGEVCLNGHLLYGGDGAAISDEETLILQAQQESQILLFDLV